MVERRRSARRRRAASRIKLERATATTTASQNIRKKMDGDMSDLPGGLFIKRDRPKNVQPSSNPTSRLGLDKLADPQKTLGHLKDAFEHAVHVP